MRKEVLFAILAGATLGLIIAFGVWRANIALSPKNPGQSQATPTPKPEFAISLASPSDLDVFSENPVSLSGITKANAFVAVSTEEEDYLTQADTKGSFEVSVELIGGVNQIVITAFDEKGSEVTQKLLLVYSSEFQKYIKEGESQDQEATDSIRFRVEQKVSQALKSPKALLGTVTDISENTLQIKSVAGEIEQISVSADTSALAMGKTNKEVKVADVAIGDYIVATGFMNGNGVLNTKRILITSPIEATNRMAIFAKVSKDNNTSLITQVIKTGEDKKVTPQKGAAVFLISEGKASKITFAKIDLDDTLVAIGTDTGEAFTARTVFVVNQQ
ncbi:MAG: hypothetical protein UX25_C0025G0004 [Candidatus Woesebacteria bacterium GW2011_GWC2_45_9]|uniref:Uncharacterized protein n=2 Tax=Microgenomates group TaxID=1794810 RepID=A0A0G1QG88_9BACT|nr:MAG: hypothetical protein UX25_C0025G0004 [Candidatus Woesebacteria bacterium GW2011_GWC2_45_9]